MTETQVDARKSSHTETNFEKQLKEQFAQATGKHFEELLEETRRAVAEEIIYIINDNFYQWEFKDYLIKKIKSKFLGGEGK